MDTYGRKFSIALFASFMLTLSLALFASFRLTDFSIHDQVKQVEGKKLTEQKQALFEFFKAVNKSNDVDWNMNKPVCDWKGIKCDPGKYVVIWLRLPAKSLIGEIPNNTIGNITTLVKLSLRNNNLTGPIPSDFSNLSRLVQFSLNDNKFSGQLPNLNLKNININQFNVSNNNLSGCIPESLSKLNYTSFDRNINLCGPPLARACNFTISYPPTPQPISSPENKSKNKFPTGATVSIAIGSPLLFLFLLSCLRKDINMKPHNTQAPIRPQTSSSTKDEFMEGERRKLVLFFEDGIYSFGVEDLLQASAEVLGKGRIGTTYKVPLMKEGEVVVVKRLKDVMVTKKDFESRMEILGKLKNENVNPLTAYYCSEVEKLLVYDYFPAGSVYDLLHGSRGSGQIPLDWEELMGIALSAAKGLAYLHVSGKLVHGNFKSSNVLFRQETKEAFVSDYGLNILFERSNSPTVTMKSDVYSFGIFLLELLTRKVPNQTSSGEEGFDLPRLVQSVPQEEWKTKVFDMELMRHQNRNVEEEMVRLLEIATRCVSLVPNQQPTMGDVVRMMKDMDRDTLSIVTL